MTGYDYSRQWYDFAFENNGKVSGNHGCLYLWFVELNNRLGWVKEFYAPTNQAMTAVGISSYTTYSKILKDLTDWGFVKMVKKAINQFQSSLIALPKNVKATVKALDKALLSHLPEQLLKHPAKQMEYNKTSNTLSGITKPQTLNHKTVVAAPPPISKISETDKELENRIEPEITETIEAGFSKKEKKSAPEKEKVISLHSRILDAYCESRPEYYWGEKDGTALKQLITKLTSSIKAKSGHDPTEQEVLEAANYIFANLPKWMLEKSMTTIPQINSNYNNIVTELKNGSNRTKNGSPRYSLEETVAAARAAAGDNY